jgi:sterol desaturase/sphingolipid hydroxylase (fatty acid hydroxylase superfamily)
MEALVRVGTFLGVLTAMLLWEACRPRRPLSRPRQERWVANLGLTLCNTILVRVMVGGVAYTAALWAADQGIGLLYWHPLPPWAAAAVTLLVLDGALYLQHVMFHAVPLLWRLHRVHHADLDFDATTGLRFHPLEILLSLGYKSTIVVLLGAVPWAVIAFEVLLNAASVFNHGNVALPERLDHWLRWVLVTPDMHRVHHSTHVSETNSNFGFSVSWWDRLCGTYRAQPALGHVGMEIGLREYRAPLHLGQLLLLPWWGSAGQYTYTGSRPVRAEGNDTV